MTDIIELSAGDAGLLLPLLEQVQDIHADAHPDIFRRNAPDGEREDFLHTFMSRTNVTTLALRAHEMALSGYLIYEVQEREISALKAACRIGIMHHIAVDQAQRGRGLGSRLIEAMKARLRAAGISKLRSEYFAFNAASAGLMTAAGLKPLSITVEGDL